MLVQNSASPLLTVNHRKQVSSMTNDSGNMIPTIQESVIQRHRRRRYHRHRAARARQRLLAQILP